MPNWCEQDLCITGPKEDRDRFLNGMTPRVEIEGTYYDILDTYYPCPKELYELTSGHSMTEDGIAVTTWREVDGKTIPLTMEETVELTGKYGTVDWYNWQQINWGTKWGDTDTVLLSNGRRHLKMSYQSPWCPISTGLAKVSKKFPTLEFKVKYYERGMQFSGVDVIKDGVVDSISYHQNYRGRRGG